MAVTVRAGVSKGTSMSRSFALFARDMRLLSLSMEDIKWLGSRSPAAARKMKARSR